VSASAGGADEVVAAANNTVHGLAAGVWSRDISTAHRVGSRLRAGTVWLNTWHATPAAVLAAQPVVPNQVRSR
jgi:acyl-CoA reductase-like NAD-dependent aldehyde dehydrogenase